MVFFFGFFFTEHHKRTYIPSSVLQPSVGVSHLNLSEKNICMLLFLNNRLIIDYKTHWYVKTMLLFQQREPVGKKYTLETERGFEFE